MDFRTKVEIAASEVKMDHTAGILLIGSCFADNVGARLKSLKFRVEHNPFGVLYNPVSVKIDLELLTDRKIFTESDLHWFDNRWISFNHYTHFSDPDKTTCLQRINDSVVSASELLADARFLFITFGTSWVYEFRKTSQIVANCHKIPAGEFRRFLLNVEDIVQTYDMLMAKLKAFNPDLNIVFTVSPIRHWKDGATGNQLSKSILLVAIHHLVNKHHNASYFPAYEIFMDELRDYRFYAKDMIHPSEAALDYVWEKFTNTFISAESIDIMKEIEEIIKAKNHRPVNPDSAEFLQFRKKIRERIYALVQKFPALNLSEEIAYFS
ncbi:MAG TPA: GSCFA domain-containing protein [Bacteroidales bacterium]|nr:GSCFA domain-containing protein [Bacteroidales bacterium]